jgi:Trp operon repressor
MSQVSKRQLSKDVQTRISHIFAQVIADVSSPKDVNALLEDFLTPAERIMLPKRLAIAHLLIREYDQRSIAQYLNVSFTTITRVSTVIKTNGAGYRTMLERMKKKEAFFRVLTEIDDGISRFLASLPGKSRAWKTLHSMKDRTPDILH